jgi:hypothetical protein
LKESKTIDTDSWFYSSWPSTVWKAKILLFPLQNFKYDKIQLGNNVYEFSDIPVEAKDQR